VYVSECVCVSVCTPRAIASLPYHYIFVYRRSGDHADLDATVADV